MPAKEVSAIMEGWGQIKIPTQKHLHPLSIIDKNINVVHDMFEVSVLKCIIIYCSYLVFHFENVLMLTSF